MSSETELLKDEIKMLFQAKEVELLEYLNSEKPNNDYRDQLIEKGIELEQEKINFDKKHKILENKEYKQKHDEIMNRIKSDFQEVDFLTQDKMYKEAREYNKKFKLWKETSKTMEELDSELQLSKKMRERIELFMENVDDEIQGKILDITGKNFLFEKKEEKKTDAAKEDERVTKLTEKIDELEELYKDREKLSKELKDNEINMDKKVNEKGSLLKKKEDFEKELNTLKARKDVIEELDEKSFADGTDKKGGPNKAKRLKEITDKIDKIKDAGSEYQKLKNTDINEKEKEIDRLEEIKFDTEKEIKTKDKEIEKIKEEIEEIKKGEEEK